MAQKEKQLLLIDLWARLPYRVIVQDRNETHVLMPGNTELGTEYIKPYLRPLSSMTEEERTEYFLLKHRDNDRDDNIILVDEASTLIDWLNSHHFDYRGLIPIGLALEAPEGMYG